MSLIARAARVILSDIEPFSKHILNKPLRHYQLEPARAILASILQGKGETFAVVMSRQAGKNETAAQLEAYLLNLFQRRGGQIVKASPTFKPQTVNSMMRLGQHLNNPWNTGRWSRPHGYMIQLGKAYCMFFSAQPSANVVGATADLLLQADEAQDISMEKWAKDFVPMAAATAATKVMWGTVWTSKTLLGQTMRQLRQMERHDGIKRVFTYDAEVVGKAVPPYAIHVKNEVARLGRHHPLIRTQYFLEEIDAEAGLFPAHRQALMRGQHQRQEDPTPGHVYALLIDVAGEEEDAPPQGVARIDSTKRDATALTVVEVDPTTIADPLIRKPSYRTLTRRLWIGTKHTALYQQISAIADHWRARYIVIDSTGAGAGLSSFLVARYGSLVLPTVFTTRTKSNIGWGFIAIVEGGRYKDYANDQAEDTRQFWYEVDACDFEARSANALKWGVWETPSYDGIIAKGHDDLLIAAALTAVLDEQAWGIGDSRVIAAPDPLADYDAAAW